MTRRIQVLIGMAGGLIWAIAVLWFGTTQVPGPGTLDPFQAVALGLMPGGFVLILLIGRLAQRRFFDDATIDGAAFAAGSGAGIDQKVLMNTIEQLVLAVCIWPIAGVVLGTWLVPVLGVAFAIARLLFWIGYHLSPPLRGLGFGASFYPTVLAGLWAGWLLL